MIWRSAEDWLIQWEGPPDPRGFPTQHRDRIVVGLDAAGWEHIVSKHVANRREPWGDLLSPLVRKGVVGGWVAEKEGWVKEAWVRLGQEVRASLARPLVMVYKAKRVGRKKRQVWTLVLPCGATACAREQGSILRLVTCYFPKAAVVEPKRERRWRRVVARLVFRYGVVTEKGVLSPPKERKVYVFLEDESVEMRWEVEFVTLESWGFATELADMPWRGRLEQWPEAAPPSPSTTRRHLRPWDKKD